MLAARRSPACAHVDAAHRSLVGNLSSLDVSHRAARANIGDVSRLRAVARPISRVGAVVGGACANAFRRRLIVVLGGSLEEGAKGL